MKKSNFLSYISSLIEKKDIIYYDEKEQYFYFYHNNLTITLQSTPSSASLLIVEEKKPNLYSESISLTSEEALDLLEKMIPLTPNNHNYAQEKIKKMGTDVFNDYLNLLDEFLKNYNLVQDIERFSNSNNGLEQYIVHFPLNGINHICRIGRISNYDKKKEHLLTSIVKIPFFFLDDNTKKSGSIPYEIIIPSWKIKDYPILENFVDPKLFGRDFSIIFENMIENLPSGKEIFNDVLQHSMPELNHKAKQAKI